MLKRKIIVNRLQANICIDVYINMTVFALKTQGRVEHVNIMKLAYKLICLEIIQLVDNVFHPSSARIELEYNICFVIVTVHSSRAKEMESLFVQ